MNHPLINLENVEFSYPKDGIKTLRDINLSISAGSFTVLVGPSGCGKSTLLKVVSGIEKPSHGLVKISGTSSFVFQSGALLPWRTVKENVSLGLEGQNIPATEKDRRVHEAIRLMNMHKLENELPRDLSGGQRQRVGIARALATSPSILFLDEPFSALDPETTSTLHQEIIDIWQQKKMTILMVSHSMEEAALLADKVIIMEKGTIKKEMNIELPRPRDPDSETFRHVSSNLLALEKTGSKMNS